MKNLILLFSALIFSLFATAQIKVGDYDRKVQANIGAIDELSPVTASSSCGEVEVEITDEQFSGGCLGTLVRTYNFTDGCGNIAQAQQYINLIDTEAPVINDVPENMIVNDMDEVPSAPELTASDNSDQPVVITLEENKSPGELVRVWTATDVCGNKTVERQVITLKGA